jgi:hypothetical protein
VQSQTRNVSSVRKVVSIIVKALENTVRSAIAAISHVDNDLIYGLQGATERDTIA